MKDLPHHMKKLNRRIIRSEHHLIESELTSNEEETGPETPLANRPQEQIRKQAKEQMRKETLSHTPEHPTPDERNREMKHRVPIFDRLSHPRTKVGAKSKKKVNEL